MDAYSIVRRIGHGSFGDVTECVEKKSGARCAVKVICNKKYETWEECLKLREVRALRQLGASHRNIVVLRQIVRENKKLFLVFDYHPTNLHKRIKEQERSKSGGFPMELIGKWSGEMLSALTFMHKRGFFHRDLKPENLLLSEDDSIRICDFGLARDVRSRPPFTDYVSTKWYRAPELVLRSKVYNSPVDIWACACVLAEVFTLQPLFPAKDRTEHLLYICSSIGPITASTWTSGFSLLVQQNIQLPKSYNSRGLKASLSNQRTELNGLPQVSYLEEQFISLLGDMLHLDPNARPHAAQCLGYPVLADYVPINEGTMEQSVLLDKSVGQTTSSPANSPKKRRSSLKVLRRDSELRLLTQEIDELAKEIQDIKTSPVHKEKEELVAPALSRSVSTPPPLPPKPIGSGLLARSDSLDRRRVITEYLNTLEDDDDDDDEDDEEANDTVDVSLQKHQAIHQQLEEEEEEEERLESPKAFQVEEIKSVRSSSPISAKQHDVEIVHDREIEELDVCSVGSIEELADYQTNLESKFEKDDEEEKYEKDYKLCPKCRGQNENQIIQKLEQTISEQRETIDSLRQQIQRLTSK